MNQTISEYGLLDGPPAGGRRQMRSFCWPLQPFSDHKEVDMTKAEEVFTKVEELVSGGMTKAGAFKQLATDYGQPVNSVRGSYYQHTRKDNGGTGPRPRRRETTLDGAIADARRALERAVDSVDREVDEAKRRADEAKAEHDALKASATERKEAIAAKLEALG